MMRTLKLAVQMSARAIQEPLQFSAKITNAKESPRVLLIFIFFFPYQ